MRWCGCWTKRGGEKNTASHNLRLVWGGTAAAAGTPPLNGHAVGGVEKPEGREHPCQCSRWCGAGRCHGQCVWGGGGYWDAIGRGDQGRAQPSDMGRGGCGQKSP